MRTSKYLLSTLREIPTDAEAISHQLMLRAGLIRKLAAGLYTWLPSGLRVLKKIENIIREEMNKVGAIEISMPIVQPADIWLESGRWDQYGPELLRLKDRGNRDFVLGPTHEEVITDLLRHELSSYKQLPLNFYQIQTKFRDEIRPRFGVMRAREFIMKDAYSFHLDKASLEQTYASMHTAYCNIFHRIGLDFRSVKADTGSIGGSISHEFQVLAESGEDDIVFSTESGYAANIELAEATMPEGNRVAPTKSLQLIETPNVKTIDDLVRLYQLPIEKTVKTLIVKGDSDCGYPLVALIIRGDHTLNEIKAEKLDKVASPLEFASENKIRSTIGASPGSLGPVNLKLPIIIDRSVAVMSDFVAGANIDNRHHFNLNWERDMPLPEIADIRNVVEGDKSPDGKGILQIKRGIEVGHIFQLGNKYSSVMKAAVQGEDGQNRAIEMGCYGIGVSRIVAAAIEQNHDEHGIIWSEAIAPFQVIIIPMNMHKSSRVLDTAENLYTELTAAGIETLFYDSKERAGVMFADAELLGIPHMIIIGDRNLDNNQVEYKLRKSTEEKQLIDKDKLIADLIKKYKTRD